MSWAVWMSDMGRLAEVDRVHRQAKQSGIVGRQLVPVGKISRFLTVCFAVAIGSIMLLPVDSDVPVNVVAITGVMLASYAPFAGTWLKLTDFERLHAPPAGLLLLRLRRLAPYLALIGAIWAGMLYTASDNGWAIVAIGVMPFVMSMANMLRAEFLAYGMRIAIVATFLLGWMDVVDWLPIVSLALDVLVLLWFVRDLGLYDARGFLIEKQIETVRDTALEDLRASRKMPDVRASRRRSLFGSVVFHYRATQWGWWGYTLRRPVASIGAMAFVGALWLVPVWAGALAVWQSGEGVAAIYCVLATALSMSLLDAEPTEQLYLWGCDMRQVERHNLLARLVCVVLPSVAAAMVTLWIVGASDVRWIAVALLLGLQLARVGLSAFNLLTRLVMLGGITVALIAFGAGTAMDHQAAFYAAIAFATFGLTGIGIRMFRSENALREHAFA